MRKFSLLSLSEIGKDHDAAVDEEDADRDVLREDSLGERNVLRVCAVFAVCPLEFRHGDAVALRRRGKQPDLGGAGVEHLVALEIVARAEQQRQQELGGRQPLFDLRIGGRVAQLLEAGIHLLADVPELLGQLRRGDRLEQVADDVVADCLLRIAEVVIAAEKDNLRRRADLAHTACQLDTGHQRHPDIGDEQIRLVLLDGLQRLHAVFGVGHDAKAEPLPVDPLQDRLPQLDLIVREYDCVHTPSSDS